ncbi:MAG: oxidoreductase [Gemmatales bacterium]|nr:MAG: oxidoreductase [Gemmatales bacterium]
MNRRDFLKSSGILATGVWISGSTVQAAPKSPNEKLNIGIIGVNHRGKANINGVKSENIVALCDVDDRYLEEAKQRFPKAKVFNDWRKLNEDKTIDAVVVSTTDHTHAPASLMAMQLGKHVYCEKPLAHNVYEARLMGETYRKCKVATQMGTQIHASDNFRRVVELIQAKAIGDVKEAHVWCGRTSGPGKRPKERPPVPSYLKWDLWLGPAPFRPYHPSYLPGNLTWNRWWDFANGTLGDMGSHLIDLPFWALNLRYPTSVEAQGPPVDPDVNPAWMIVRWHHPEREGRPPVEVVWYHGGKRPENPPGVDLGKWFNGILFVGNKGMLLADYGRRILLPKEKFADFKPPEPTIPKSLGHYQEWIHACKTGAKTLCNFDYSGALIEHNLLGNVAYRCGQKLEWDADKLKATNCPEADRFIHRTYRKGWELT